MSLTARAMVALLIFERYCRDNRLVHAQIDEFIEYMWHWPKANDPGNFEPWERSRPELVNAGLVGSVPGAFATFLAHTGTSERRFCQLLSNTVLILWSSFWGACEDEGSFQNLTAVVVGAQVRLPPLTPFKFSSIEDGGGWGHQISEYDLEYWKSLRRYA